MNVNKHKRRAALKSAHTVTLTLALPPPPQCDCCALISACNYVFMAAHTVVIVLNKWLGGGGLANVIFQAVSLS